MQYLNIVILGTDLILWLESFPVLSSRCILNMKRLMTLKYKQWKTSKASWENNLEV